MKKFIAIILAVSVLFSSVVVTSAATGELADEPPFEFYAVAGYYHGFALGVVRCKANYTSGSAFYEVSYSQLTEFVSTLNSAQSYYQFMVANMQSSSTGDKYMVTVIHPTTSGKGFSSTYEGRLGGYADL